MAKCLTNALGFPRSARSFEVVPWIHTRISSTTMDVFHHGWMWGPILMAPLWDGGLCLIHSHTMGRVTFYKPWPWWMILIHPAWTTPPFGWNIIVCYHYCSIPPSPTIKETCPFVGFWVIHPNLSHKTNMWPLMSIFNVTLLIRYFSRLQRLQHSYF